MKKLWKIALIALIVTVASCGTYVKQPVASHIVAVTITGDTILVAIDKIRPNMYRSYYPIYSNYNYYRPYYGQEYQFRYPDNRGISYSSGGRSSNGGGSNNSGGGGKIIPREKPPTPDIQVRPSGETLLKTKK
jgi:uncharacterized membrane protein YgcG